MTDAIRKAVWSQLLDYVSRSSFLGSHLTRLGEDVRFSDTLELPQQVAPTRVSAPHTRAAPQALGPTITNLSVDQEVFYNINVHRLTTPQRMNGRWRDATVEHAFLHMMNEIDDDLVDQAIAMGAWDAGTTPLYHTNLAADAISAADTANAEATMLNNKGTFRQNLIYVGNPFAVGSVKVLSSYLPGFAGSEAGRLGIPQVGSINGIPVFETDAAPGSGTAANQFSVDATSSTVTTNQNDATVPTGHGFVDGQLIYTSGFTTDVAVGSAVAIDSVDATSILYAVTACNGDNGAGTIYAASSYLVLIDTSKYFWAVQEDIDVEFVKDFEGPDTALQLYAAYGRRCMAGAAHVIHSPLSSVS